MKLTRYDCNILCYCKVLSKLHLHSVHWGINPSPFKNTFFLVKPPLNWQIVQALPFQAIPPPLYIVYFYIKIAPPPPSKRSPPLSHQPPSKKIKVQSSPPFWKFSKRFNSPSPAERGEGVHTMLHTMIWTFSVIVWQPKTSLNNFCYFFPLAWLTFEPKPDVFECFNLYFLILHLKNYGFTNFHIYRYSM